VDGPGLRFAIFTQGCPHHCPGCHNPQTHAFNAGYIDTVESLYHNILKDPLLSGVTFSGGEPFEQALPLAELAKLVHNHNLDVITYTGYKFEYLWKFSNKKNHYMDLILQIDYIIDGKFDKKKKNYELNYTGSTNQRIIDCKKTLEEKKIVIAEL
jgi:anaerobic ribonucleoside-triphosphate reductase activating protein